MLAQTCPTRVSRFWGRRVGVTVAVDGGSIGGCLSLLVRSAADASVCQGTGLVRGGVGAVASVFYSADIQHVRDVGDGCVVADRSGHGVWDVGRGGSGGAVASLAWAP